MKKIFCLFLLTLLTLTVSAQEQHKVTLTANPSHGGCVNFTSPPSTLVGSVDNYKVVTSTYNKGDIVECYAAALEGFRFTAWKKGNAIVSTDNPMTFVMGVEDLAYEAVFVFDPLSPSEPGGNYFNPETGEVRIINTDPNALANGSYYSDSERAGIYDLIKRLTNDIGTVKSLTLIGQFPNLVYGDKFLARIYNLESVDLSRTNIKIVESRALSNSTLETVILPASLTEMDSSPVFAYEGALKDVYCYAPVPPQATSYTFITQRDTLTWEEKTTDAAIHVPIASVPLYKSAEGWKDLNIVPIEDGTLSITVQLPAEAAEGSYQNMSLVLEDRATLLQTRYTIGKQAYCVFTNLPSNTSYHLRLENAFGQALGEVNNVPIDEESVTVAFPPLKQLCNTAISVKDFDGNDLTEKAQVKWTLADGTVIGQQSKLSNVLEGTPLFCKVFLGEELATSYSTPAPLSVTVQPEGENSLTCQLQPLRRVTLSGQVINGLTGLPLQGASVVLRQMIGGLYHRSLSATTDEEGHYTLQAYSENGTISFSAQGCLTQSLDIDAPTESQNLETVALQSLTGATIYYMLTYTPTVAVGETPEKQENYTDNNTSFAIYNFTKGQQVTQFVRQGNRIVITDGADIGDELQVTMTNLTDSYEPVTGLCAIDDTNYGEVTLDIVQRGRLVATPAEGSMAGIGLLYDSSGQLFRQGTYGAENMTLNNLPAGDYTLVSIGATAFKSVLRLSALAEAGLVEGTDYVGTAVTIQDGLLTAVNVGVVPRIDNAISQYTTTDSYFMADKASLSIGDYETLKARVAFKPEFASRISDVQLVVDLPDGVNVVPGSLNGYQMDGQRITINLDEGSYKRFCVTTTNVGTYRPSAFVRFTMDGEDIFQPIGNTCFEARQLTFGVPEYTCTDRVDIWGNLPKAFGGCDMQVFDNGMMVWQGLVPETGKLEMEALLYKPLNNSWHQFTLKVLAPEVGVLESQTKVVQCYYNTPILDMIALHALSSTDGQQFYFNMRTGKPSAPGYRHHQLWGPICSTFNAYFLNSDPEKVQNFEFIIYTQNGKIFRQKGIYDAENDMYACNFYPAGYHELPVNVSASYQIVTDDQSDYEGLFNDQMEVLHQTSLHIEEMVENHMTHTELLDELNHYIDVKTLDNGYQLQYESTIEDYDAIEQEMCASGNLQCMQMDGGVMAYSVKTTDEEIQVLIADTKERVGLRIKITEYADPAVPHTRRRMPSFSNLLNAGLGLGNGYLTLVGAADYMNVPSQLKFLELKFENNIKRYNKLYDRAFKAIMNEKCGFLMDDPGLSVDQKREFMGQLNDISQVMKGYIKGSESMIDGYIISVGGKAMFDVAVFGVTKGVGKAGSTATKFTQSSMGWVTHKLKDMVNLAKDVSNSELIVSGLELANSVAGKIESIKSIEQLLGFDFEKDYQSALDWLNTYGQNIENMFSRLMNEVDLAHAQNCKKKHEEDDEQAGEESSEDNNEAEEITDFHDDEVSEWPGLSESVTVTPIIDPQGYVYEGVPSNRLAGVTATVFYKQLNEDENGNPVEEVIQWDAAQYGQINPQITGADGMYQWFVPEGLWQVKVEKEGYETAYSEWLPVPPPQLDVNIAMKQSSAPEVKDAKAYEEGINITFDKYMLPTLLTTDNISVLQGGDPVEGTIEMQDKEATEGGDSLVSKVRFVPETPFTQNKVTLSISRNVQSYAYMLMSSDYEQELNVALEVKTLKSDSLVKVAHGGAYTLLVEAKPANAAAGKKVTVESANTIAAVNEETLTLDEEGKAMVDVRGLMLGNALITFSLDETDLTCQTIVQVREVKENVAETPVASIESGSTVDYGTTVTLTCATENAKIWYTLDGTCPCVSDSRVHYTVPILLPQGDVTLNVMAEAEGYVNSEVGTYLYHVNGNRRGDVNGDGLVNVTDVSLTISFILGKKPQEFNVNAADLTGDSIINVSDVSAIINIILGK